jgi:hypothetical protein
MILMKPQRVVLCLLFVLLSGCMTERFQPATDPLSAPQPSTFLVKKIGYDEHGRPLFSERLSKRPGGADEQFSLVHVLQGKPVRSYDILIVDQQHADMGKPLAIVYEWTGKGFEAGFIITGHLMRADVSASGKEALAIVACEAAPIVIGGVTGFLVGIVSSIPEAATELRRVVVNTRETVVGYTVYEYDEKGRIRFMKMYPPAENVAELVTTEFFYEGENRDPSKTEVTSMVEKKIRLIQ